jgi:hypothetical protein
MEWHSPGCLVLQFFHPLTGCGGMSIICKNISDISIVKKHPIIDAMIFLIILELIISVLLSINRRKGFGYLLTKILIYYYVILIKVNNKLLAKTYAK